MPIFTGKQRIYSYLQKNHAYPLLLTTAHKHINRCMDIKSLERKARNLRQSIPLKAKRNPKDIEITMYFNLLIYLLKAKPSKLNNVERNALEIFILPLCLTSSVM